MVVHIWLSGGGGLGMQEMKKRDALVFPNEIFELMGTAIQKGVDLNTLFELAVCAYANEVCPIELIKHSTKNN